MNTTELLTEHFRRIPPLAAAAVDGLTAEQLAWRPDAAANSIAWLVWHLARVQDDHIADVAERDQVWTADDWAGRFALPLDDADIGFGHSAEQVAAVRVEDSGLLTGYVDAVTAATQAYLADLTDVALDRVVDERWDPPVTLGVRLISVIGDDLQHAGQANYLRGLVTRRA